MPHPGLLLCLSSGIFAAFLAAPGCQPAAAPAGGETAPVAPSAAPAPSAALSASLEPFAAPHDCEQRLSTSGPVVFSPDGKRIAVGNDSESILVLEPGRSLARGMTAESARTKFLGFAGDGRTLVSVADPTTGAGDVYVWDVATGTLRNHGTTFCFQTAILAPDSSWVATVGCHGGFDFLETAAGGQSLSAPRPPMRGASAADISLFLRPGDPALVLSDSDGTLEMWSPRPFRRLRPIPVPRSSRADSTAVATFSPDGSVFVLADMAGGLSIRDGKSGRVLKTLRKTPGPHEETSPWGGVSTGLDFDVSFRADGQVFALAAAGGDISLRDARSGALQASLRTRSTPPPGSSRVTFAHKSHRLVSTTDSDSELWESDTNRRLASLPGLSNPAWSPDDSLIAWAHADGLVITDSLTGAVRHRLPGKEVPFRAWSPDGRFLLATQDDALVLLRLSDGVPLRLVLLGPAAQPTLLASTADGSQTLDGRAITCLGSRPPGSPPPAVAPALLSDFLAGKPLVP